MWRILRVAMFERGVYWNLVQIRCIPIPPGRWEGPVCSCTVQVLCLGAEPPAKFRLIKIVRLSPLFRSGKTPSQMRRPKNSKSQISSLTFFFFSTLTPMRDRQCVKLDKMIDPVKILSALCAAALGKGELFCACVMSSLILPHLVFYSAISSWGCLA